MNTTKNYLELRDGYLCIKSVDTDYSEPALLVCWYPCFKCNSSDASCAGFPLGAEMICESGGGTYQTASYRLDSRQFELESLGATKPIHFERIPLAPPKSTKPIRWMSGCFQKCLKTGWVNLPINFQL